MLVGVCALAALAGAIGAREHARADVPVSVPIEPAPASRPVSSVVQPPAAVRERTWPVSAVDPFKPVSFEAPVAAPIAAVPLPVEPAPIAPVFPYRFFGRMTGPDGKQLTYLARGENLLVVSPGGALEGDYRIETMSDNEIIVVYSPLNEKTVINIRAAE
ncbi:hypothetical protein DPH57_07995 [Massilia sp. YMA4]|nr:hypothetical protein DPH57_07995 [Massilia sp. YMA4]